MESCRRCDNHDELYTCQECFSTLCEKCTQNVPSEWYLRKTILDTDESYLNGRFDDIYSDSDRENPVLDPYLGENPLSECIYCTKDENIREYGPQFQREEESSQALERVISSSVFPHDVLFLIFGFLHVRDVIVCGCVCTEWRKVSMNPILWKIFYDQQTEDNHKRKREVMEDENKNQPQVKSDDAVSFRATVISNFLSRKKQHQRWKIARATEHLNLLAESLDENDSELWVKNPMYLEIRKLMRRGGVLYCESECHDASLQVMQAFVKSALNKIKIICTHRGHAQKITTSDVLEGLKALSEMASPSLQIYTYTGDNVELEGQWQEANSESEDSEEDEEYDDEESQDEEDEDEEDLQNFQAAKLSESNAAQRKQVDVSYADRLRWVRNMQSSPKTVMTIQSFHKWMKPIVSETNSTIDWEFSEPALLTLQEATEDFMIKMFEESIITALVVGKRTFLTQQDIGLYVRWHGRSVPEFSQLNLLQ